MQDPRFILACVLLVFITKVAAFSVEETEFIVEVLAVVDKPALDSWLKKEGVYSKDRVVEEITAMYLEVDLMYQSFRAYGINIRIRLFDVHFAETSILEGVAYNSGSGTAVGQEKGLEAFGNYVHKDSNTSYYVNDRLSGPDQSTFFTASSIDGAAGVAFLDNICHLSKAVSMVNIDFFYTNVKVVAHELGHNLNMPHDEDSCKEAKMVMYYMVDERTLNRWFFSSCSAERLYKELEQRGGDTCMSRTSRDPIISPRMGELLTADQFCKRYFGLGVHPDYNNPDDLCEVLWCWDGFYDVELSASPEGLPCGDGSRCFMGKCVLVE